MTLAKFNGFLAAAGRRERRKIADAAFAARIAEASAADYKRAIKELDNPE